MKFEGWRYTIALLASVQAHTVVWAYGIAPDAPSRLLPHALRKHHHEQLIEIEVEPFLDTPLTEDEGGGGIGGGGSEASSIRTGQGHTAERRNGSATGSHGRTGKSAKAANVSPGPSLDWLYARVAARANEDPRGQGGGGLEDTEGGEEGAKGEASPWHTPAHVQNPDWRACPVAVPSRPAYAHVIADVDAEGHALAVRLIDADPGTNEAAIKCARDAHYIPAHDAKGVPVRGRTRVFRVEFPQ